MQTESFGLNSLGSLGKGKFGLVRGVTALVPTDRSTERIAAIMELGVIAGHARHGRVVDSRYRIATNKRSGSSHRLFEREHVAVGFLGLDGQNIIVAAVSRGFKAPTSIADDRMFGKRLDDGAVGDHGGKLVVGNDREMKENPCLCS